MTAADFNALASNGASASVGSGINIIYDQATGNLFYDSDGGGSANRVLFATLTVSGGTVDASDFVIF